MGEAPDQEAENDKVIRASEVETIKMVQRRKNSER